MSGNDYCAFLLRMRRVGDGVRPKWNYTIQDAATQTQHRFKSLGALMLFLEQQTDVEDAIEGSQKGNPHETV